MNTTAVDVTPRPSAPIMYVMEEARRRFESFQARRGKSLTDGWTGLGMPSYYAPAVKAGLMKPLHDKIVPRVLTWYLLTNDGINLYRQLFPGSYEGTNRVYKDGVFVGPYDLTLPEAA